MIIENIQVKEGTEASIQGIESYSLVTLDHPGIQIPRNIYVSRAQDPQQAALDMYWMMHRAPINFATWSPGLDEISQEVRDRVAQKMQNDPEIFTKLPITRNVRDRRSESFSKASSTSQQIKRLRRQFKKLNSTPRLGKEKKDFLQNWGAASISTLDKFLSGFPQSSISISFDNQTKGGNRRCDGERDIRPHIDGTDEHKIFPNLSVKRSLRFLWSQNDIGTFCADQDDVEYNGVNGGVNFKNPNPTLYIAEPWSFVMVSGSNHDLTGPAVHGTPSTGQKLSRILWDMRLMFNVSTTPTPQHYLEWLERFEPPEPMPLIEWAQTCEPV